MEQVDIRETNASKPLKNASIGSPDVETMDVSNSWDKSDGNLVTGQAASGVKVA